MEDLWEIHELVSEKRYLMDRTLSAGRHEGDTLYHLIYDYPDSAFLTMFHMHRNAFWKIVELLTPYWKKTEMTYQRGRINIRDIGMQVAVRLLVYVCTRVQAWVIEYMQVPFIETQHSNDTCIYSVTHAHTLDTHILMTKP